MKRTLRIRRIAGLSGRRVLRAGLALPRWCAPAGSAWLVLLLAIFSGGCRSAWKRHDVLLLPETTGLPFADEVHAGAVASARDCGLAVHYVAPPRADDLQMQIGMFQRSVAEGFAGSILLPVQAQAFRDPVRRAAASGMQVVVLGRDLGVTSANVSYILSDEAVAGRLGSEAVARAVQDQGSLLILGVDPENAEAAKRDRALETEIALHHPRIRIRRKFFASASVTQEQQNVLEALNEDPAIDAIVALNATSTRGAYYALAGRAAKRVHIVGFDQDILPPVQSGEIDAVVAQRTVTMGRMAGTELCSRLARGTPRSDAVTLVPPFLLDAANYGRGEASRELGALWWDPDAE